MNAPETKIKTKIKAKTNRRAAEMAEACYQNFVIRSEATDLLFLGLLCVSAV
jgi:hypothetical protein